MLLTLVAPVISPFSAENSPGTLNQLRSGYTPVRFGLPFLATTFLLTAGGLRALRDVQGKWRLDGLLGLLVAYMLVSSKLLTYDNTTFAMVTLALAALGFGLAACRRFATWLAPLSLPRYGLPAALLGGACLGLVVASVEPVWHAKRLESRDRTYSDLYGRRLGRTTRCFEWCDQHLHNALVEVCSMQIYPFFGPDFSNQARAIHIPSRHAVYQLRYVILARNGDPDFPTFGEFPVWRNTLEQNPERYRVVFEDECVVVFHAVY